jgi:putative aldouronate transport system permease protein
MASISNPRLLMAANGLLLMPLGNVTVDGYGLVFKNQDIISGYGNTILYVLSTTIIGTVLTVIAGYAISRNDLKLKTPITLFILFTLMFSGGLIPSYMVNRTLGLINNRLALIIPGVINAFYIIMVKSAFEQLSSSFEESAKLDGAGPITILVQIISPMIKATIAVIVMFTVVMQWNSWFPASIYLTQRRDAWPLQLFLREILVQNDTSRIVSGNEAQRAADLTKNLVKYCTIMVGTFPMLCIYPFVQKHFVKGVTLGGLKG